MARTVLVLFSSLLLAAGGCGKRNGDPATTTTTSSATGTTTAATTTARPTTTTGEVRLIDKGAYKITHEVSNPDAGIYSMRIIVAPAERTEPDLRKLGQRLREDTAKHMIVAVRVYDDLKAAQMSKDAFPERLSKQEEEYIDKHHVGLYQRNTKKATESFKIWLEGARGPAIDVDFK